MGKIIFIAVFLVGMSGCTSRPMLPADQVRYESIGRTSFFVFSSRAGVFGQISPQKPTSEQQLAFDENLGHRIIDCSTASFECLRTWFRVFAIPREPLAAEMTYIAGGAQLAVEKCLRGSATACQVALVSADCQLMVGDDSCALFPGGRTKSPQPGPITYFIYNEDYGVTAFGTAGEWPQPAERVEIAISVAGQFVLKSEIGLLRSSGGSGRRASSQDR